MLAFLYVLLETKAYENLLGKTLLNKDNLLKDKHLET